MSPPDFTRRGKRHETSHSPRPAERRHLGGDRHDHRPAGASRSFLPSRVHVRPLDGTTRRTRAMTRPARRFDACEVVRPPAP